MEFLQKLMGKTKNMLLQLKKLSNKKSKEQTVEPLEIVSDSQIIIQEIIKKQQNKVEKEVFDKEIQTDSHEPIRRRNKIQTSNYVSYLSKRLQKQEKTIQKLQNSIHQESEKTEPSQYSYCQNHFLDVLELNEKQEYDVLNQSHSAAKRKSSKQVRQQLFSTYIKKIKENIDQPENLIQKNNQQLNNNQ